MSNIIKAEAILGGTRSGMLAHSVMERPGRHTSTSATSVIDAAAIVISAKERAAAILRAAQQRASQMIAEEHERIKSLREASVEQGYQEGYSRGYEEGKREAEREAYERLRQELLSMENAAREIANLREQALAAAENDMVKFSVLIAEKIVRGELANPERTLEIARSLLSQVRDESHISIFLPAELNLSSEDISALTRDEFTLGQQLQVETDPALALGDVRVETRWGWIDGRASVRWARLIDALRKGIDDHDDAS